jgi:hypothetical protein
MDLMNELLSKQKELNISVKNLRHAGSDFAKAQKNYRIALAIVERQLRNEGVPVSIVKDLARGDENVADLKEEMENKLAIYRANMEAINSIKTEIRIIENQLNREFNMN